MALQYIKKSPEESLAIIAECIVTGYQTKDLIVQEYNSDKQSVDDAKVDKWSELAIGWANQCLTKLAEVFVSQKELYNFRDAQPPFGATSDDVRWFGIVSKIQARINKLNEYDQFIQKGFDVKIEVMRDKYVQEGSNSTVEVQNEKHEQ